MSTQQNVIAIVLLIAVLSIAGVLVELMMPPDSSGAAADSYGVQLHGGRAVFETLQVLQNKGASNLSVKRGLIPPDQLTKNDTCLFLWQPAPSLVQANPVYLEQVAKWVRQGGAVVIAPASRHEAPKSFSTAFQTNSAEAHSILDLLGLPGVTLMTIDPETKKSGEPSTAFNNGSPPSSTTWILREKKPETIMLHLAKAEGVLAPWAEWLHVLQVRKQNLQVVNMKGGPTPIGSIKLQLKNDNSCTLVALYASGKGTVMVVSDPFMFANAALGKGDNAVLAIKTLTRTGSSTIFDEFYHGLTIRGNPAFLLTRHPYGLVALLILIVGVVWGWRQSIRLGPPLAEQQDPRRNLGEYIDAMANLFHRGKFKSFLLEELLHGVLWELSRSLRLGPGKETIEALDPHLTRRDPKQAEKLRRAVQQAETLLDHSSRLREDEVVQVAKELTQCL